jgi:hypothetical protein
VVGTGLPGVSTQDANLAGVRALQALSTFDGRRLAGAVGPEHRGHLLMASSPRHIRKGSVCAKSLGQIAHSHGLGHGQSLGVPTMDFSRSDRRADPVGVKLGEPY